MKCNQSHPGFELVSPCPFPTTITIAPLFCNRGCLKIDATHLYDNSYCYWVIFHLSLKNQSCHFRKVKPDDKGRNWLTLSYSARERRSSWEHLRRDFFGLLPTEFLTASTLSEHLAVSFQPDLGFLPFYWGCLLTLWLEICVFNNKFGFSGVIIKLNLLQNFACTVLNDFVSN